MHVIHKLSGEWLEGSRGGSHSLCWLVEGATYLLLETSPHYKINNGDSEL
jgi:hypothetical protein